MRYSRNDLLQLPNQHLSIDEDLTFEDGISEKFPRIRKIKSIHVSAEGDYLAEVQHLNLHLNLTGTIVVGCDITGVDVDLDIESEADEVFSFNREQEDIDIVKSNGDKIELLPTIFQMILMEIPIKVVKPGKIDYPKGDGWEVISEEDYRKLKENRVDPRLAILQDYKPQDE